MYVKKKTCDYWFKIFWKLGLLRKKDSLTIFSYIPCVLCISEDLTFWKTKVLNMNKSRRIFKNPNAFAQKVKFSGHCYTKFRWIWPSFSTLFVCQKAPNWFHSSQLVQQACRLFITTHFFALCLLRPNLKISEFLAFENNIYKSDAPDTCMTHYPTKLANDLRFLHPFN